MTTPGRYRVGSRVASRFAIASPLVIALHRVIAPFAIASLVLFASLLGACDRAPEHAQRARRVLSVCADPNNLPFSSRDGSGFENRIAEVVARELNADLRYTWWPQRRGFVRNTLRACSCDVVVGVPTSFELAATTAPYYRSGYVFVTREDRGLAIASLDDPRLGRLRIGVQLVGDDGANTPPVHALSARGLAGNLVGYTLYGDYSTPHPPSRIVDAVSDGEVDVAIAWGPMAAYFARRAARPLRITPVLPEIDPPYLPFVFDIAMGVRRDDTLLLAELDGVIRRRHDSIDAILARYDVPRRDHAHTAATVNSGATHSGTTNSGRNEL
jgi:mxaJ protein